MDYVRSGEVEDCAECGHIHYVHLPGGCIRNGCKCSGYKKPEVKENELRGSDSVSEHK